MYCVLQWKKDKTAIFTNQSPQIPAYFAWALARVAIWNDCNIYVICSLATCHTTLTQIVLG